MSWSPAVYKFVAGDEEPVAPDMALVRAVLEPYDVTDPRRRADADGGLGLLVRAPDGSEAEMYADEHGVSVVRPQGGGVFDIMAELACRLGAVVIAPGDPMVVCRPEEHPHLPPSLREAAHVIEMTGADLEFALTGNRRP
ncbi:hypothetical protein [Streptomyces sennicomposti]|uniref:hypothetical protein n=1 Tax=Streptomyces sennicomposti TaxID=2873384 RepID=UPI001CA7B553|nr:hypothetical protein [Streptomyces sennicomposti]MBY8869500.1 hypothetical protein [Streptomyces sennicomposti]